MDAEAKDHLDAKTKIQKKYFKFEMLNDEIPLFCFVGRMAPQKGAHLIADLAEELINHF